MTNSPKAPKQKKKSSKLSNVFTVTVMLVAIVMVGLLLTNPLGLGSTLKESLNLSLGGSIEPVTTTHSHPLIGGQPVPAENDSDCLKCHKSLP